MKNVHPQLLIKFHNTFKRARGTCLTDELVKRTMWESFYCKCIHDVYFLKLSHSTSDNLRHYKMNINEIYTSAATFKIALHF